MNLTAVILTLTRSLHMPVALMMLTVDAVRDSECRTPAPWITMPASRTNTRTGSSNRGAAISDSSATLPLI
jgi:hypothetical protein